MRDCVMILGALALCLFGAAFVWGADATLGGVKGQAVNDGPDTTGERVTLFERSEVPVPSGEHATLIERRVLPGWPCPDGVTTCGQVGAACYDNLVDCATRAGEVCGGAGHGTAKKAELNRGEDGVVRCEFTCGDGSTGTCERSLRDAAQRSGGLVRRPLKLRRGAARRVVAGRSPGCGVAGGWKP